jgi:hypothetical protein
MMISIVTSGVIIDVSLNSINTFIEFFIVAKYFIMMAILGLEIPMLWDFSDVFYF